MLRNIMEGRYTFTSPEWDDITGMIDELKQNVNQEFVVT